MVRKKKDENTYCEHANEVPAGCPGNCGCNCERCYDPHKPILCSKEEDLEGEKDFGFWADQQNSGQLCFVQMSPPAKGRIIFSISVAASGRNFTLEIPVERLKRVLYSKPST